MSGATSASSHHANLVAPHIPVTCSPSPCERLSRSPWWDATPTTTTGTPLPWGSRPVGNPVFRHRGTSESDVGPPLIPFNELIARRPSTGASHSREVESVVADGTGVQACYRWVCIFTPGY